MKTPDRIRLDAAARAGGQTLQVPVRVQNAGDHRAFVRLIATNGTHDPGPGLAYACFRSDEEALHLLAGQPPESLDADFFAPAMALARGVEPGETIRHLFELPLPVEEWNPHDPFTGEEDDDEVVTVERVLLSVEWLLERDITSHSRRDDYPEGFYRVVGAPVETARADVRSDEPIPVLVKRRPFPRF